ncbi:MAG: hypothetical protein E7163_05425 [Firmicutes bacterium]|nr:hypothetical protein [Bacillota bacterium]
MKKTILYIIILILACALTGAITYILVDKNNTNEKINETNKENFDNSSNNEQEENDNNELNNNDNIAESGIKSIDFKEENDIIIAEISMLLNGTKKVMNLQFDYEYIVDTGEHRVFNNYNGVNLFDVSVRDAYKKEDIYNINNIKKDFSLDNFKIIKGYDNKDYLIIITNKDNDYKTYIYNDNYELISKNMIDNDYYSMSGFGNNKFDYFNLNNYYINVVMNAEGLNWYDNIYCDVNEYQPCHTVFKIENNKIYYLALKMKDNYSMGDYGVLEERVYTINNNKLTYEVINTYKVTEIGNMI